MWGGDLKFEEKFELLTGVLGEGRWCLMEFSVSKPTYFGVMAGIRAFYDGSLCGSESGPQAGIHTGLSAVMEGWSSGQKKKCCRVPSTIHPVNVLSNF